MRIEIHPPLSIHEIGQRNNQEDSIIQWNNRLFVLCDGMGGHEHGEVASQTVCQSLVRWFEENVKDDCFTDDQLRTALEYAYKELDKYADGSSKQMGTTLTLLYIGANGITAAHMGDSRIYHIRPISSPKLGEVGKGLSKGLLYQSRDHSLVFDLFQAGEITYEEMATYPQKNIVTRAMTPGEDNRMRPDIIHITDVQPSDYFYLCSDGMLEQMSNDELVSLFSSDASDKEKRQQLIAATANNQDNHSAWLIHVKDVIKEDGDERLINEELSARCNALNIKPPANPNEDVQIIDNDDDVVVVSTPKPLMKKPSLRKIVLSVFALLLAMVIIWFFFLRNNKKEELQCPKPMMHIPIVRQHKNDSVIDTITKDTDKNIKYESAGNQQPVNASRRDHSTRHIQDR